MKAIAKRNIIEYEEKWTAGNKYDVVVDAKEFVTIVTDDYGIQVYFCGEPKHLEDKFDFMEE